MVDKTVGIMIYWYLTCTSQCDAFSWVGCYFLWYWPEFGLIRFAPQVLKCRAADQLHLNIAALDAHQHHQEINSIKNPVCWSRITVCSFIYWLSSADFSGSLRVPLGQTGQRNATSFVAKIPNCTFQSV